MPWSSTYPMDICTSFSCSSYISIVISGGVESDKGFFKKNIDYKMALCDTGSS